MKKIYRNISIGSLGVLAIASPSVLAISCGSGSGQSTTNVEFNWDEVNVIFGGADGLGKAEIQAPEFEHVKLSLDKSNHLEYGESVVVTAEAEDGYSIDGKVTQTKEYKVTNLITNNIKNITLTKEDLDVKFEGSEHNGHVTIRTINPGISFVTSTSTTLSNGDKITITANAKNGYTVNGKSKETFEFTVSNLPASPVVNTRTNIDFDGTPVSVGEFTGWNGAATFNHDELANDTFYTISDPVFSNGKSNGHLSNGDSVSITFTPTPGHTINGDTRPKTYTYTASRLPDLPVQNLELTNDDFTLEYGWVGDKLRVSVACSTWFVTIITHTPMLGITEGSQITLEVVPDLGFTINGKTSDSFTFTANNLPPKPDQLPDNVISVSSESFGIGFPGIDGQRTTTIVEKPPHVNISLDRMSGLTTGDNVVLTATPEDGYEFANGQEKFVHTYSVREPGLYDLIEDNPPVEYLWVADDPENPSHTWWDSLLIRDAQFGIFFPKNFADMTPWDFGLYLVNMYNNAGSGIMDLTMSYKGHEDTVHVNFKEPLLSLISTFAEADITPETPRSDENMLITAARMGLDDITRAPKLLQMFLAYGNDLFFPTDHNQGPITGSQVVQLTKVAQLGLRIVSGESEVANRLLPAVAPFPDSTLGAFSNLADIFTEMTKGFADSEVAHAWAADQDQQVQDELGTRDNCMMANTYIRMIMLDAITK